MRKYFYLTFLITAINIANAFAALPFITDDAAIQDPKQLALETFAEKWDQTEKSSVEKEKATLYGYFLSASYGLAKNFELTLAGNIGYDTNRDSTSFTNPILQLKTKLRDAEQSGTLGVAIDLGYVNQNGKGEYFDNATNYYAITAITSRLFSDNLIVHLNIGKKASYNIEHDHLYRTHLGIGFDIALIDKLRVVIESYNGAPNSPRDSPDYFRSYQIGFKWLKSEKFYPYIIYGSQPTYAGEDSNYKSAYRQTSWTQIGARMVF